MQSYKGIHLFCPKGHSAMSYATGSCALGETHCLYTFKCTTLESRKTQLPGKAQSKHLIEY